MFAFVTVNLFSQAMANLEFLGEFGWVAIQYGGLWQVIELFVWGALALSCWLVFKICEHLLEDRYIAWSNRSEKTNTGDDALDKESSRTKS